MWLSFDPSLYGLWGFLEDNFRVEISDDPDFLLFSVFGADHLKYDCQKLYISHEASYPDFRWCDYAITFHPDISTPRHFQLPNFPTLFGFSEMRRLGSVHLDVSKETLEAKTRFAAYLASNGNAKPREDIVTALSEYRMVDCGGRHRNNVGYTVPPDETIPFLSTAKFTISCENSIAPGYVTEKLVLSMFAGAIPIYWGSDYALNIFNPERIINARDFSSLDDLVDRIRVLNESDELYLEMLSKPCLHPSYSHAFLREEALRDYFDGVFSGRFSDADRARLTDSQYGAYKGVHRRLLQAPMNEVEAQAFEDARSRTYADGLSDAKPDKRIAEAMKALCL